LISRLLTAWAAIRDSLWATPLAIAVAGGGLAVFTLTYDAPWVLQAAWLYSGAAPQAPEFASSLVGAMITLTSLAFSITMVVLTLAAQQLGPRLIHLFLSDASTKIVLGLFLGTIVYLLFVLRALDGQPGGHAPALAITGGTGLVLCSVVALLFFVHSLGRSIVADRVVARVGDALDKGIHRVFPSSEIEHVATPQRMIPIAWAVCGYVRHIDYNALVRAAQEVDAVIVINMRVGSHVLVGETCAWRTSGDENALARALSRAVLFARERGDGDDPDNSLRRLVEIALRALSPGINDQFTAIAVIERLSASFALLLQRAEAPNCWRDTSGTPRLFGRALEVGTMLDAAFAPIFAAAQDKEQVTAVLKNHLMRLSALAPARRKEAIDSATKNIFDPLSAALTLQGKRGT
jgi:uncharacterized membrane protein